MKFDYMIEIYLKLYCW